MVFSSILFLFRFLPIVLALYFLAPVKFRNLILFIMSLIFYAWGEPVYVVLMIFSTIVDYTHGRMVQKFKDQGKMKKARLVVASSVIINLLLLGFFKYSDFLIGNINSIFNADIPLLNLTLPIGISFYTFQTMSYTIDVYRGQAPVQKNIISFGAYVALFPQLIAGPIVQYKTIANELNHHKETFDGFADGITRFVTGLGKKVLLANNIGLLWDTISATSAGELSVVMAWLGAIAFTFQIYFDFSGYSDMAIGLGKMFGFNFPENFNYPYKSKSITEFWRRWHITLGTWFREYVYIPLGGNRCKVPRQIFNIAIVWCLTGIWHGASWNFMIWGVYFGILLILEKTILKKPLEKLPSVFKHIYTMFLVIISWVIFAFDDLKLIGPYLKTMFGFGGSGFIDSTTIYTLLSYGIMLVILVLACTDLPKRLAVKLMERIKKAPAIPIIVRNVFLVAVLLMSIAYLVNASYNPFLYFRF